MRILSVLNCKQWGLINVTLTESFVYCVLEWQYSRCMLLFLKNLLRDSTFKDCPMDSPRQSTKANLNREPKRSQNQSSAPPQKDAYARLLSQHNSSKFSLYLEQYAKETSFQWEGHGPSTLLRAQSDRLNIPQRKRDQVPNNLSDSSDFSPSSMKSKGEDSSLSLYMEKLITRSAQQDCERKQGVSDRQRRGQRRDTATSHDGDIESGEELCSLKPNQSKKQQKKNKDSKETDSFVGCSQSPKKASTSGQEQKVTKPKKKNLPKNPEEDESRQGALKSGADAQMSRPKSPHGKDKKLQQPKGKLLVSW